MSVRLGRPGRRPLPPARVAGRQTRPGILAICVVLTACAPVQRPSPEATPIGSPSSGSVRAFAVGDLGYDGDRDDQMATIIESHDPDAFLALGDTVYPEATDANFRDHYHGSYGRLSNITWPTPGNHDYRDGGYGAYVEYFDEHAPGFPAHPYYAFNLGAWRMYSLNSEIDESDPGDAMYDWLQRQLEEHPAACIGAMWHTPVHTVGDKEFDEERMQPIYDLLVEHGVDLVLTAHDHNYQRWDIDGTAYFVVGTGGKSTYDFERQADGLAFGNDEVYGALELELSPDGGRHAFRTIDDEILDPGKLDC